MRAAAASAAPQGSTATHIDVSDTGTASGTHWQFLTETEWQQRLDPEWTPPGEDSFNTLGRGYFLIEDGADLTVSGVTHTNTIYIASGAAVKLTFLDTEITWAEPDYTKDAGGNLTGIDGDTPRPAGCLHVGEGANAEFSAAEGVTITLESENSDLRAGVIRLLDNASLEFSGMGTWNVNGYAVNSINSNSGGALIGSNDLSGRFDQLKFDGGGTFNVTMKVDKDDNFNNARALIGDGGRTQGFNMLYFGDCEVRCTYYYDTTRAQDLIPFFAGMSYMSPDTATDSAIVFTGATFIGRVETGPNTDIGDVRIYSTIGKAFVCSAGVSVLIKGDSVIDIDGGIGYSDNQTVPWNQYNPCEVNIEGGLVMCKGSLSSGIGADRLSISGEDTYVYATTERGGDNPPPAIGGWNGSDDAEVDIKIASGASVMAMTSGGGVAIGGASIKDEGIGIEIVGRDTVVMAVSTGGNAAIGSGITAGYTVLHYDKANSPILFASSIRAKDNSGIMPKEFDADDYPYVYDSGDARLSASLIDLAGYPADTSGLRRILGGDIYMLRDISLGTDADLRIPKYWNIHLMEHVVNGSGDHLSIGGKKTTLTTIPSTADFTNYRFAAVAYGNSPGVVEVNAATVSPTETLTYEWYEDDDGDSLSGVHTSTGVTSKGFYIPADLNVGTHYFFAKVRGDSSIPRVVDMSTPCFEVRVVGSAPVVTEHPAALKAGYTGSAVPLVQPGTVEGGTFVYALGDPAGPYSEAIPTATEKGSYWVYYQIKGDSNHTDDTQVHVLKSEIVDIAFSAPETLPAATINNPYAGAEIKGTGLGELTVEVLADNLPEGMSYDPSTGVLSGTPARSGTFLLVLRLSTDKPDVEPVEGDFRLKVIPLTFSFYGNGGSYNEVDKVDLPYTGAVFVTPPLTRDGHTLLGFADRPQKANRTGLITDFSSYTNDMDFFAVWDDGGNAGAGGDGVSGGAVDGNSEYVLLTGGANLFRYKASKKGNTMKLKADVLPPSVKDRRVVWRSSNTRIATVSRNGLVRFKGREGVVTITATAADGSGKYASKVIKVAKNVTRMRSPVRKVYIKRGKSLTLPVAMDDKTAPKLTVASKLTWESSKPKVVSVSAKGRIKASKKIKKKTKVTVTATAYNGRKLEFAVYVVPKAKKLDKAMVAWPKKARLKKGRTYIIKVRLYSHMATGVKVTFKSSKKSVLTVDRAGKLVAKKKGKATVTVKVGKKAYKKKITVK
jgi:uncharacterized protein YjdB